jgi:type I restriction enzyme M protein
MAVKKSQLYSSIWESCNKLRGGMDSSQYKDYVLVILFIKYVSDKAKADPRSLIFVPEGSSFDDMLLLKGKADIGDKINKQIVGRIAEENDLKGIIDVADFNDSDKLGKGKEMVDKLSDLIEIFNKPELDFGSNKAGGDDILGDAYEFLMKHFATESGKSKGQFYTPSEVSRIMAKVIGINKVKSQEQTIYDCAAGSGSLLLKVADEALSQVTIYGQEKDVATAGLAKMNMILHNNATARIEKGYSTLSNPQFLNTRGQLETFDFCVANPPFSLKNWSDGFTPSSDVYERFLGYGTPPDKNGDYAFLLHILASLKSNGKGAVILPHGVLFRGNSEQQIRTSIIKRGYVKGIIGLPANLFFGTGIPACIILLDKENAAARKGIFFIDASKGFIKDGNKNRLREQDIHKIVDVFNNHIEIPKFSRMVPMAEIEEKGYNLNIPRYIDNTEPEDLQNIDAHLNGGIPDEDIEALQSYWDVYPSMKADLFIKSNRDGFSDLKIIKDDIKKTIFGHPEFHTYSKQTSDIFNAWKINNIDFCKSIDTTTTKPKEFIHSLSENLLISFTGLKLIDKYDLYQHLMVYWLETMQDDSYLIVSDGWEVGTEVEYEKKEFEGKLIPKSILISRYFNDLKLEIENLEAERDTCSSELESIEEEHSGEDGYFTSLDKLNKGTVAKRLKDIKADKEAKEEVDILNLYLKLNEQLSEANKKLKEYTAGLDKHLLIKYKSLTVEEIKLLVVEDKWIATIEHSVKNEMQRISQRLTLRVKELAERYELALPSVLNDVKLLEEKVNAHLTKMGYSWK